MIVVDGGGALERALWGDKMSRLALDRGVAGIVIDGAVRDVDGIETLRFPVFAAGVTPTPPRTRLPGELDLAVACGDVTVRPGDYVYGDRDGVVVVPSAIHAEIARTATRARGTIRVSTSSPRPSSAAIRSPTG